MARATVRRRLTWQVAQVAGGRTETASARTLVLRLADWPEHLPGQHVDVRLTAEDGYSTQRSYSIGSAPGQPLELTVQRVPDGEVSSYLVDEARPGDELEVRGPVGGYFVWHPAGSVPSPVLLAAGGSGIVPLMSMVRARAATTSVAPFRLLYSVRAPDAVIYAEELHRMAALDPGLQVVYAYTRQSPDPRAHPPRRIDAALLAEAGWAADAEPACFVCGPTGFVEAVSGWLLDAGHDPTRIKTERFGPTGGIR